MAKPTAPPLHRLDRLDLQPQASHETMVDGKAYLEEGRPVTQQFARSMFYSAGPPTVHDASSGGSGAYGQVRKVRGYFRTGDGPWRPASFAVKQQTFSAFNTRHAYVALNEVKLHPLLWNSLSLDCRRVYAKALPMSPVDAWLEDSSGVRTELTSQTYLTLSSRGDLQLRTTGILTAEEDSDEEEDSLLVRNSQNPWRVLYSVQLWAAADGERLHKLSDIVPSHYRADEMRHIAYQIGVALRCLHTYGIVHNDTHHGNILVIYDDAYDEYNPDTSLVTAKLIDLGLARQIHPWENAEAMRERDVDTFVNGFMTYEDRGALDSDDGRLFSLSATTISNKYKQMIREATLAGWRTPPAAVWPTHRPPPLPPQGGGGGGKDG